MRCWHKDLIPVLPRQQLLGQWRECCLIAKNIAEKGTPNHLLVNRIMDYPLDDFYTYCYLVKCEMDNRGYKTNAKKLYKNLFSTRPGEPFCLNVLQPIFKGWHDRRYLQQCFFNLQEKYDCGGISSDEWETIYWRVEECLTNRVAGI